MYSFTNGSIFFFVTVHLVMKFLVSQADFQEFKTVTVISKEVFESLTPSGPLMHEQEVPPPPPVINTVTGNILIN